MHQYVTQRRVVTRSGSAGNRTEVTETAFFRPSGRRARRRGWRPPAGRARPAGSHRGRGPAAGLAPAGGPARGCGPTGRERRGRGPIGAFRQPASAPDVSAGSRDSALSFGRGGCQERGGVGRGRHRGGGPEPDGRQASPPSPDTRRSLGTRRPARDAPCHRAHPASGRPARWRPASPWPASRRCPPRAERSPARAAPSAGPLPAAETPRSGTARDTPRSPPGSCCSRSTARRRLPPLRCSSPTPGRRQSTSMKIGFE